MYLYYTTIVRLLSTNPGDLQIIIKKHTLYEKLIYSLIGQLIERVL